MSEIISQISTQKIFGDLLGAEKMLKISVSDDSADLLSWRRVEVRAQLNQTQPRLSSSLEIFLHPRVAKVTSSLLFFLQHLAPHLTSPHHPSIHPNPAHAPALRLRHRLGSDCLFLGLFYLFCPSSAYRSMTTSWWSDAHKFAHDELTQ